MTAHLSPEQREELRRLLDEATPGPWEAFTTGSEGCSIVSGGRRLPRVARLTSGPLGTCQADAALIVAAVNALPALLDALDAGPRSEEGLREAVDATDALPEDAPDPSAWAKRSLYAEGWADRGDAIRAALRTTEETPDA